MSKTATMDALAYGIQRAKAYTDEAVGNIDLSPVEAKLDGIDAKIDDLSDKVDNIHVDLTPIEAKLDGLSDLLDVVTGDATYIADEIIGEDIDG